ncbi:hypothetical protein EGW08_007931, partial [Elysia chlorotica]
PECHAHDHRLWRSRLNDTLKDIIKHVDAYNPRVEPSLRPAATLVTNCVGDGPCRCAMSDGTGTVDISSLGNQDGTATFPEEYSYDNTVYAYNPCFPISKGGSCKKSAVCQKQLDESYTDMGQQESAVWAFTGYYSQVTYT